MLKVGTRVIAIDSNRTGVLLPSAYKPWGVWVMAIDDGYKIDINEFFLKEVKDNELREKQTTNSKET